MAKPNKKNKHVELLMKIGHLRIFQHPEKPEKTFSSFEKPMFSDDDGKKRCAHITEAWWREKHNMMLGYVTNSMGYVEVTEYSKMEKISYSTMVERAKKHIEFHEISEDSAKEVE